MESNLVTMVASTTPIPSNPQVFILPSHHHLMLMLWNQPSEAKAAMSNPHFLCFIEFILIIMNHWTLSLQILSNHSSQSTMWDLCSLPLPNQSMILIIKATHSLSTILTDRSSGWWATPSVTIQFISILTHYPNDQNTIPTQSPEFTLLTNTDQLKRVDE